MCIQMGFVSPFGGAGKYRTEIINSLIDYIVIRINGKWIYYDKNTERREDPKNDDDDKHSYPPLFLTVYNLC